jgi:hypothetical protein
MSLFLPVATGVGIAILGGYAFTSGLAARRAARERFIRQFTLPDGLYRKLHQKRPEIDPRHHPLVARALRQFFLCHLLSGRRYVSMPSQVVDDLWHEFILYTKNYQLFCNKAFGRFLHHTPAVVLGHGQTDDIGLRRAWRFACLEENINPRNPSRLPLLFAIDEKLGVADGFRYRPDCRKETAVGTEGGNINTCCGADLGHGEGSFAGSGDSWFGGGSDGGSSFGGDSGGDSGGSSCGGGGCGGGGD